MTTPHKTCIGPSLVSFAESCAAARDKKDILKSDGIISARLAMSGMAKPSEQSCGRADGLHR